MNDKNFELLMLDHQESFEPNPKKDMAQIETLEDLINVSDSKLSIQTFESIVNSLHSFDKIKMELKTKGSVTIRNFGRFSVKKMAEKKGHNFKTGEIIVIPEHEKVVFKPAKNILNGDDGK